MILYVIARNKQEYERITDAVLKKLNAQHDETYGAVVPVNGVADLQLPYRRLPGRLHVLLAPRYKDRKDWAELDTCLTEISAKVMDYESFTRNKEGGETAWQQGCNQTETSHRQAQCGSAHTSA